MIKENVKIEPDTEYKFTLIKDFSEDILRILKEQGYDGNYKAGDAFYLTTNDNFYFKRGDLWTWYGNYKNENIVRNTLGVDSPYLLIEYSDRYNLACPLCGETKCHFCMYTKKEIPKGYDEYEYIHYMDIVYACGHRRTL